MGRSYRYYIERADSPQTRRASALIHRSYFRPLTRVRYDLIGQDRVLEQLFRVLSMPSMAPIVVLLCGELCRCSNTRRWMLTGDRDRPERARKKPPCAQM